MNKLLVVAALLSAALATGCAHVDISSKGSLAGLDLVGSPTQADRQVVVRNSGVHMFWTISLGTGDLRWDDEKNDIRGGTALFGTYCGTDNCMDVLQHVAERENCDLVGVYFTDMTKSGFDVSSFSGLFGWLAGLYEVQACGILRPRAALPLAEGM